MFSSDKNIETIRLICSDVRKYIELRAEYVKFEFVSKLTVLMASLILGTILFILGAIVLLLLSATAVFALSDVLGGTTGACAVVTGCYIVIGILVYMNRRRLIINPVANFLGNLFLNSKKRNTSTHE